MAFHISKLGCKSATVQQYADKEGVIPEKGDHWQDFNWPRTLQKQFADQENGEAYWHNFLEKANFATLKAKQALDVLRNSDEWYKGKRRKR